MRFVEVSDFSREQIELFAVSNLMSVHLVWALALHLSMLRGKILPLKLAKNNGTLMVVSKTSAMQGSPCIFQDLNLEFSYIDANFTNTTGGSLD